MVQDLRRECEELRKAQDAPLAAHPEYRVLAIEADRLALAMQAKVSVYYIHISCYIHTRYLVAWRRRGGKCLARRI
jgi:hypothetical protein